MKKAKSMIIVNVYYIRSLWDKGTVHMTHVVRFKQDLIDLFIKYNYPYNFAMIREIFAKKQTVVDIYVKEIK